MRIPALTTTLLGATALVAFALPAAVEAEVGAPAPNAGATEWFNHIGTDFDISALKGQAVVLEFWATW
jgi:hypothetical protein